MKHTYLSSPKRCQGRDNSALSHIQAKLRSGAPIVACASFGAVVALLASPAIAGESERKTDVDVNNTRGSVGLFHLSLPSVGQQGSFRVRLGGDYFRKRGFFCCASPTSPADTHQRTHLSALVGFTFWRYAEAWFGVHGVSNRNEREQDNRQDPTTVFALGDLDFGLKLASTLKNPMFRLGFQSPMQLLASSPNDRSRAFNAGFEGLFSIDWRERTNGKKLPLRLAFDVGWTLDNSLHLVDWSTISDPFSREVLRYSLGTNNSRILLGWSVDAPIRFGKTRSIGWAPILEHRFSIATHESQDFVELDALSGKKARGVTADRIASSMLLGTRTDLWHSVHLDVGAEISLLSPTPAWGPRSAPWQLHIALSWIIGAQRPQANTRPTTAQVKRQAAPPPRPLQESPERTVSGAYSDPRSVAVITRDTLGNPIPAHVRWYSIDDPSIAVSSSARAPQKPGRYRLQVALEGYQPISFVVEIAAETQTIELMLRTTPTKPRQEQETPLRSLPQGDDVMPQDNPAQDDLASPEKAIPTTYLKTVDEAPQH